MDTEVQINKLLAFGLLYCKGDHREKANAFYDILQDAFQEQISASDKELVWAYVFLIQLATAWVHVWSQMLIKQPGTPKLNLNYAKIDKNADPDNYSQEVAEGVQVMFEDFLD